MNIVFDIGNVLIAWDLHAAFRDLHPEPAEFEAFLARTDFFARNLRGDQGETFAALAAELADPADRAAFADYPARFPATIRTKIAGSWEIMAALRARGHRIHAITNWSAETWPHALALHPELDQAFETRVVSGHEGLIKPQAEIFALLCARAGVAPAECLFIDDALYNVQGARAAGLQAHHFTTPDALARDLTSRGLL